MSGILGPAMKMRAVAIVVLSVTLALGLALVGSVANGGESRKKATLQLSGGIPLTLRGANFLPGERVRVTISGELRRTKQVTATRAGAFVVRFSAAYDRCSGLLAVAVGARGSRAVLKLPPLACPAP